VTPSATFPRFAVFDVDEHGAPIHEWTKTATREQSERYVAEKRATGYELRTFELVPTDRASERTVRP
jgi:hypothetical protein